MRITKHIDWLALTFPNGSPCWVIFPTLDWHYVGKGSHGYKAKYVDSDFGATSEQDGHDPTMGNHLVLSGNALNNMRAAWGISDDRLMQHVTGLNGKCSRIDLAINLHGSTVTPDKMSQAIAKGKISTPATSYRFISGKNDQIEGNTLYIGSRTSDRFFRAYDKNAESGIVDKEAWLRLELEVKALRAKAVQKAITSHPVTTVISSQINDYVKWNNPDYLQAIGDTHTEIELQPRKETNTVVWLLGVVATALARQTIIDDKFMARFTAAVESERKRIEDENRRNHGKIDK